MHSKIKLVDTEGIHKEKSYSIVHKDNGLISFIIKIYYPSEGNNGGKCTPFFDKKKVDDFLEISLPKSSQYYIGNEEFFNKNFGKKIHAKNALFISGGTGLVPFLDIFNRIFKEEKNTGIKTVLLNSDSFLSDLFYQNELEYY